VSSIETPPKRSYDARARRERAEQERGATRARVIEAASRLFVANGYTGTTMADIARDAGVAIQSVYAAARSKADLIQAAIERAVAGDEQEVLVHQRPPALAISEERDPVRQVRLIAELICEIQERSGPLQAAYRQAAAIDPKVASHLDAEHRRRLESFGAVLRMLPPDSLRHPIQDCIDTAWATASPEVFLLLRNVRGWDWDRIRAWLTLTLIDLLLTAP
jgi:AcrR family transcriptional regulator